MWRIPDSICVSRGAGCSDLSCAFWLANINRNDDLLNAGEPRTARWILNLLHAEKRPARKAFKQSRWNNPHQHRRRIRHGCLPCFPQRNGSLCGHGVLRIDCHFTMASRTRTSHRAAAVPSSAPPQSKKALGILQRVLSAFCSELTPAHAAMQSPRSMLHTVPASAKASSQTYHLRPGTCMRMPNCLSATLREFPSMKDPQTLKGCSRERLVDRLIQVDRRGTRNCDSCASPNNLESPQHVLCSHVGRIRDASQTRSSQFHSGMYEMTAFDCLWNCAQRSRRGDVTCRTLHSAWRCFNGGMLSTM